MTKSNVRKLKTKESIPEVQRNSEGLRNALFDELDALRQGKSTAQRASAVSKLAVQIINSATMEVEFQKYVRSNPTEGKILLAAPIKLGS